MASTANSVSAANRASGNNLQNTGARQSLRTNASFKGADASRRQSASPGDGAQRYVMIGRLLVRQPPWDGIARAVDGKLSVPAQHKNYWTRPSQLIPPISGPLTLFLCAAF